MKQFCRAFLLTASALSLLLLCACGSTTTVNPDVKAEVPQFVEEPEVTATPVPAVRADAATEQESEQMTLARQCIDKDVAELYKAIGEPKSADYASSCLGSGEDGELYYDGFTVATYREGSSETVRDVF